MRAVIYDLETGGLLMKHPIIQIGAVAVDIDSLGLDVVGKFEAKLSFVKSSATEEALNINSYDEDLWNRFCIHPSKAVKDFAHFLKEFSDVEMISRKGKSYKIAQLIGKNVIIFDQPRLIKLFQDHDTFLPGTFRPLDVQQFAQWVYFVRRDSVEPSNYKLQTLQEHLLTEDDLKSNQILSKSRQHDALFDAEMIRLVLQKLRSMLE